MTDSLLANILAIVYIILSIAIIALVLLQKGKTAGMGAISGGMFLGKKTERAVWPARYFF